MQALHGGAENLEIRLHTLQQLGEFRLGMLGIRQHRKFLHGGDNNADEQIEDGESGDHDERAQSGHR